MGNIIVDDKIESYNARIDKVLKGQQASCNLDSVCGGYLTTEVLHLL